MMLERASSPSSRRFPLPRTFRKPTKKRDGLLSFRRRALNDDNDAGEKREEEDDGETVKTTMTNFDRLVQQNKWMFPQPQADEEEESLRKFWRSRGVKDREMLKRLIALGSGLAEMRLEDEFMTPEDEKARDSLANRLDRMKILFPRCDVNAMLWKKPEVLERSFREITKAAIEWKVVLKDVKHLDLVVENNPQILLMTSEEIRGVKDGLDVLTREFFSFEEDEDEDGGRKVTFELKAGKGAVSSTTNDNDDSDDATAAADSPPTTSTGFLITPEFTLANIIEGEPYILTSNLKERTKILLDRKQDLLEKAKSKGSGLGLFYLRKSTSTALFGKLFLMDTECEEDDNE
jgi:hypothetical protein